MDQFDLKFLLCPIFVIWYVLQKIAIYIRMLCHNWTVQNFLTFSLIYALLYNISWTDRASHNKIFETSIQQIYSFWLCLYKWHTHWDGLHLYIASSFSWCHRQNDSISRQFHLKNDCHWFSKTANRRIVMLFIISLYLPIYNNNFGWLLLRSRRQASFGWKRNLVITQLILSFRFFFSLDLISLFWIYPTFGRFFSWLIHKQWQWFEENKNKREINYA